MSHTLIGKPIKAVYQSDDDEALKFVAIDGEEIIAVVDADCCSYTWIESIDNPEALIGTVTEADNIDMPDLGDQPEHDVMAYYGFRIATERGSCVIDYRNDSNGYYGGSLDWPSYKLPGARWKLIAGREGV